MRKLLFETATLADAAQRAARVAPTKGVPFDRAAGIVLTADPEDPQHCVLSATDLTVSFRTVVTCLEMSLDGPVTWRVPAGLFAGITSALPMSAGSVVTLAADDPWVFIVAGESKSKVAQITLGSYPIIEPFDAEGMAQVPGFSARLAQVAWACSDGDSALSGVHLDGHHLYACDRARMAFVPCDVPIRTPVTAPLAPLAALIRTATDVTLRATERRLEIMPDPYTQMTAVLHLDPYPDVSRLVRDTFTGFATVAREVLAAALTRMMVLVRGERLPRLRLEFGPGWLRLDMDVPEVGRMLDRIEIGGGSDPPFSLEFTPNYLVDVIAASSRPVIQVAYGPTALNSLRFTDDNDFYAVASPRQPAATEVAA